MIPEKRYGTAWLVFNQPSFVLFITVFRYIVRSRISTNRHRNLRNNYHNSAVLLYRLDDIYSLRRFHPNILNHSNTDYILLKFPFCRNLPYNPYLTNSCSYSRHSNRHDYTFSRSGWGRTHIRGHHKYNNYAVQVSL